MAISWVTVADSISKVTVSGVTIKDLDETLDKVTTRDTPVMMPAPTFITGMDVERVSMGTGSTAQTDAMYTLNYRYFHSQAGANRKLSEVYAALATKIGLIVDAIIANDTLTGSIDIQVEDIGAFGPVSDPIGNIFFGCDISFRVLEFENG